MNENGLNPNAPKPKAQTVAERIAEIERCVKHEVEVSLAACSLALRRHKLARTPRMPKRWTGMLVRGRRARCGQAVILPDSTVGEIYGILRGRALVWRPAPFTVGERVLELYQTDQLKVYRLPSAVVLGGCKKGIQEVFSPAKVAACRRNGSLPAKRGRRGRPKQTDVPP